MDEATSRRRRGASLPASATNDAAELAQISRPKPMVSLRGRTRRPFRFPRRHTSSVGTTCSRISPEKVLSLSMKSKRRSASVASRWNPRRVTS